MILSMVWYLVTTNSKLEQLLIIDKNCAVLPASNEVLDAFVHDAARDSHDAIRMQLSLNR